jgi:hypothetical protein
MAFSPLMLKLVACLRSTLQAEPTVIELGNQTFKPRTHMLPRVGRWLSAEGVPHDAGALGKLASLPVEERPPHTATFYRALGFASYDAIDVNARFGSLRMDLNQDLRIEYGFDRTFDLVTNNGTGEHVFDQRAVLANVHSLAKPGLGAPGGVMLHVLPFFNWLNHGFYGFHPLLFVELAAANGYELLRLSIASNRGREARVTLPGVEAGRAVTRDDARAPALSLAAFGARASVAPGRALRGSVLRWPGRASARGRARGAGAELEAALRWVTAEHPHVSVVAALRRRGDAPFAIPLQGLYSGANVDSPEIRARYAPREAR